MINLTIEEAERLAYIEGRTAEAAMLAQIADLEEEIADLENEADGLYMLPSP